MFPLIRAAGQRRYIHEGRVFCPTRSRDVESDLCAGCALATDIQLDQELSYVRCRPEPRASVIGWWGAGPFG